MFLKWEKIEGERECAIFIENNDEILSRKKVDYQKEKQYDDSNHVLPFEICKIGILSISWSDLAIRLDELQNRHMKIAAFQHIISESVSSNTFTILCDLLDNCISRAWKLVSLNADYEKCLFTAFIWFYGKMWTMFPFEAPTKRTVCWGSASVPMQQEIPKYTILG